MKIGIIGSGRIGGTLAKLFSSQGHEVAISNSRGPETLRELEAQLGGNATAMTAEDAATFGEVVVVSIPFKNYDQVPRDALAGKVVIDTNNYYPDRDGHFDELDQDRVTSSEMLAAHLEGTRVVKAFNAIRWTSLRDLGQHEGGQRIGIPISGDDQEAKHVVAKLIREIGFEPVDAGGLADGGRKHQPGMPAYGADLRSEELRARVMA
jgi:predicted dinucleotide-binding enzyme